MSDQGESNEIVEQFSAKGRQERAEWYFTKLETITGRRKEPSHGGSETFFLAHEVGNAFVNGLYISTILLCAGLVEQEIFGELVYRGEFDSGEHVRVPEMLETAVSLDLLTPDEETSIRELHDHRISFFHYRDFDHDDSPLKEVFENQEPPYHPYGEYEERARAAIVTWLTIAEKPWTEWVEQE